MLSGPKYVSVRRISLLFDVVGYVFGMRIAQRMPVKQIGNLRRMPHETAKCYDLFGIVLT
jgi:hypothetical protein